MKKHLLKCSLVLLSLLLTLSLLVTEPVIASTSNESQTDTQETEYEIIEPSGPQSYEELTEEELANLETVPLDSLEDSESDNLQNENNSSIGIPNNNEQTFSIQRFKFPYGGAKFKSPIVRKNPKDKKLQVQVYKPKGQILWQTIRNQHLANKIHYVTKIPYNNQGFPLFPGKTFTVKAAYWKSSKTVIWNQIKKEVKKQVTTDFSYARKFNQKQIAQIKKGEFPSGFVLHHHHKSGTFQLVDKWTHSNTGHTGGKVIWGSF